MNLKFSYSWSFQKILNKETSFHKKIHTIPLEQNNIQDSLHLSDRPKIILQEPNE